MVSNYVVAFFLVPVVQWISHAKAVNWSMSTVLLEPQASMETCQKWGTKMNAFQVSLTDGLVQAGAEKSPTGS